MSPPYGSAIDAHLGKESNRCGLSVFRNKDRKTIDAEIWMKINEGLQTSKKYTFTFASDTTNYALVKRGKCRYTTNQDIQGHIKFTKIDTANFIVAGIF